MNSKRLCIILAAFASFTLAASAAIVYVAATGSDIFGDGSAGNPYASISNGVAHAGAGDTVSVGAGAYGITTQIVVTNGITVQGAGAASTIVQRSSGNTRIFWVSNGVLDGLTITNGFFNDVAANGGGIYMATGTVRNCTIIGNVASNAVASSYVNGGGIFIANGMVTNCLVAFNTANNIAGGTWYYARGGGVYISGTALLTDSVISNNNVAGNSNQGLGGGGGVAATGGSILRNCTIITNTTSGNYSQGSGIYASSGTLVTGCLIKANYAAAGYGGGVFFLGASGARLDYCVISNNSAYMGGGVYDSSYSACNYLLTNCFISGNSAADGGGGVCLLTNGTFRNCTISGNSAKTGGGNGYQGGGIFVRDAFCNASLYDCTISRNSAASYGGGVLLGRPALGTINLTWQNCTISSNYAPDSGGGVYIFDILGGAISNCLIVGNTANSGGGIYCRSWYQPLVQNCIISNNYGGNTGAGVYMGNNSGTLRNCLVSGNGPRCGIYMADGGTVQNCTVSDNTANYSGYAGGIYAAAATYAVNIYNTIAWFNIQTGGGSANSNWIALASATNFNCCIAPTNGLVGTGNIGFSPQFAGRGAGNYRLATGSACINAGTNQTWMTGAKDLDGFNRKDQVAGIVDIGAYEYRPAISLFRMR